MKQLDLSSTGPGKARKLSLSVACLLNVLVCLRDGSAATLRRKLQMKLATSLCHGLLTMGQPVITLAPQLWALGRVTIGIPIVLSLV